MKSKTTQAASRCTEQRVVGSPTQVSLPCGGTAYEFDEDSGPPPGDWICPACKGNAGDWSRPIDEENIEVNHCDPELAGLWECGQCGNTEWVPHPNTILTGDSSGPSGGSEKRVIEKTKGY